jgi:hypothetical protein
MSAAKIVGVVCGLVLLVGGFLGVAVSLFAIFDPAGTQMADDANPFGPPPSPSQLCCDSCFLSGRLRHWLFSHLEVTP